MGLHGRLPRFAFTFIVLLVIWLGLSGKFDVFHAGWGVVGAAAIAALTVPRLADRAFPLLRFLAFVPWQLWQILISNLRVARLVLTPSLPIRPRLLKRAPNLRDPRALTLLGCSITLTPGTLTVDINDEYMIIHALDDASAEDIGKDVMAHKVQGVFGEDET